MVATSPTAAPQIIIIDDDQFVRDFTVHAIEFGTNQKVTTFDNGFNAWQYIQERSAFIDVIIADANIPDINGLELLERIKNKYPAKSCIITSSNPKHETTAHQKGADAFLFKPFDANDLFGVIEQFVLPQRPKRDQRNASLVSNHC